MRRVAMVVTAVLAVACAAARADESVEYVPTAGERAAVDLYRRNADAFVHSSDLRLRILYSTAAGIEMGDRPEDARPYWTQRITGATLYADSRGSTDPLVLALLVARCGIQTSTAAGCDRVDLATRWTAVDTQNQVAWLTLAAVRGETGDEVGARAAFLRAADAPRWHSHALDVAQVVARAAPRSLPTELRNAYLAQALDRGYSVLPLAALQMLTRRCKEDGDVRRACARIVTVLARDAESLLELSIAVVVAARAGVDPLVVAGYREQVDAMRWALQSIAGLGDVLNETDPEALRRDAERLRSLIESGERKTAEDALLARGIPKSVAAARHVATLSPGQLERRAAP